MATLDVPATEADDLAPKPTSIPHQSGRKISGSRRPDVDRFTCPMLLTCKYRYSKGMSGVRSAEEVWALNGSRYRCARPTAQIC